MVSRFSGKVTGIDNGVSEGFLQVTISMPQYNVKPPNEHVAQLDNPF
jgi:hypothetical protein